ARRRRHLLRTVRGRRHVPHPGRPAQHLHRGVADRDRRDLHGLRALPTQRDLGHAAGEARLMSATARTVVTLAPATAGGGSPVFGQACADAIHAADPSLEIQQRNTKGSTENVPLLERGEVDLGLVQGEVAYEAITGIGRAPADLRILTAMYSTAGMF